MPEHTPQRQVVDLGTKKAGALNVFIKHHGLYFPSQRFDPSQCLGVDYTAKYKAEVEKQGYAFSSANVLKDFEWPTAEYYLAFDFLEHMPDLKTAQELLARMIEKSSKGVWVRMPSFELDETNIAQLERHNLRFTWTTWHYHPAHLCRHHVKEVVDDRDDPNITLRFKKNMPVRDSSDWRVVPDTVHPDVTRYDPAKHGPKPKVKFDPPLIGQWEALIKKHEAR